MASILGALADLGVRIGTPLLQRGISESSERTAPGAYLTPTTAAARQEAAARLYGPPAGPGLYGEVEEEEDDAASAMQAIQFASDLATRILPSIGDPAVAKGQERLAERAKAHEVSMYGPVQEDERGQRYTIEYTPAGTQRRRYLSISEFVDDEGILKHGVSPGGPARPAPPADLTGVFKGGYRPAPPPTFGLGGLVGPGLGPLSVSGGMGGAVETPHMVGSLGEVVGP